MAFGGRQCGGCDSLLSVAGTNRQLGVWFHVKRVIKGDLWETFYKRNNFTLLARHSFPILLSILKNLCESNDPFWNQWELCSAWEMEWKETATLTLTWPKMLIPFNYISSKKRVDETLPLNGWQKWYEELILRENTGNTRLNLAA